MTRSLRRINTTRALGLAAAAVLALGAHALAQSDAKKDEAAKLPTAQPPAPPTPPASPYKSHPVRKPVVDLQQMAKERRPGQVMPGDPAPMSTPSPSVATDMAASTPAAPAATSASNAHAPSAAATAPAVKLPDTAPPMKAALGPRVDNTPPAPRASSAAVVTDIGAKPAEIAPGVPAPAQAAPGVQAAATAPAPSPTPTMKPGENPAAMPLVESAIVKNPAMPLSTGPARVKVESMSGGSGVQWRSDAGAWREPSVGETIEGRVEVRVGLDSELVLTVDDRVQVRASRLARALIERDLEAGSVTSVGVILARGAIELNRAPNVAAPMGAADMFGRVRTPDQTFGVTGPLRVEYDAFTGTKRRVLQ